MFGWKFAPDAHKWHALWSVRFAALGAVTTVASVVFPGILSVISPLVHPGHYAGISLAFFVAIFVSRLVDQQAMHPDA